MAPFEPACRCQSPVGYGAILVNVKPVTKFLTMQELVALLPVIASIVGVYAHATVTSISLMACVVRDDRVIHNAATLTVLKSDSYFILRPCTHNSSQSFHSNYRSKLYS
jgi:hypothetical protein